LLIIVYIQGYASILKIANLLNSDTRRKSLYRSQKHRAQLIESCETKDSWQEDDIIVNNVSYAYHNQPSAQVLSNVSFRIESGQIVSVGGEGSVGKKSLLKLLARHFKPMKGGFIHYPPHFRTRFLDNNTAFFGGDAHKLYLANKQGGDAINVALKQSTGTLDYNLKFGCQFKHPDPDIFDFEIYNLLRLFGLSTHLIGHSFSEYSSGDDAKKYTNIGLNGEKLSQSNRCLLSLVCALLSSVDLLIICNILDVLGPQRGSEVIKLLREFTENRGLPRILKTEHGRIPFYLRKKKTVIYSTKIASLYNLADNWIHFEFDGSEDNETTITSATGDLPPLATTLDGNDGVARDELNNSDENV
jgi:energy-coupling factor transporter ATP-binding protein EcfA2